MLTRAVRRLTSKHQTHRSEAPAHPYAAVFGAPLRLSFSFAMESHEARRARHLPVFAPVFVALILVALTAAWLFAGRDARGAGRGLGFVSEWLVVPAGSWPLALWSVPLCLLFLLGGLAALSAYDRFHRAKTVASARNSTRLALLSLSLLAALWPFATLNADGAKNLIDATWSDTANQYFSASYGIENARDFTREYSRFQTPPSRLQAHVATHPPGAVLLYFAARRFLESAPPLQDAFGAIAQTLTGETALQLAAHSNEVRRSAARAAAAPEPPDLPQSAVAAALFSASLFALFAAFTVPAIYDLAAGSDARGTPESAPQETRGLTAAAFFALAPNVLLFAWTLDIVLACLASWSLVFLMRRLRGGKVGWLYACGALLALTTFVSFGALALFFALAALLFLDAFSRSRDETAASTRTILWKNAARDFALITLAFFATWIALSLIFPMNVAAIYARAMQVHHAATLTSRSRTAWIWMNVLMFFLFCGWPLVTCVLAASTRARKFFQRDFSPLRDGAFRVGIAMLALMLLLTFSGQVRGEVERLWLFLLPPLCAMAGAFAAEKPRRIYALLALQAAQTLLMASALAPLVRPI